jgi:uncharacterized damage-inducible protein DinB
MRDIIDSFKAEYEKYKGIGEGALGQLEEAELSRTLAGQDNSAAAIVWHVCGNLASRFSDFLTSDGEKPWRDRESEFQKRTVTRAELMEKWESGWTVLLATLATLTDTDLGATVTIRGQPLSVRDALVRSLSHTASHIGQIVYLAKTIRGERWRWLSIPPGQSAAYNQNPVYETGHRVVPAVMEEMADRLERCVGGTMWHGPSLSVLRDGMSAAEASARPIAAGHTIAEMIRHMTVWSDFARQRLRGEEAADPADAEDWPLRGGVTEEALRALWTQLEASYRGLAADVRSLTEEQLAAPVRRHRYTVADMVRGVVEHGTYHGGQIAILLRAQRGPVK